MFIFPSEEWCRAVIDAIHSEPDSLRAGKGFQGDLAAIVLPDSPAVKEPFVVWARVAEGRVTGFRLLEDLDEVEEISPAYVARAGYLAWKKLILGELDSIEAVLRKQIEVSGDLEPILQRAHFKDLVKRVLAKVPTRFA